VAFDFYLSGKDGKINSLDYSREENYPICVKKNTKSGYALSILDKDHWPLQSQIL